MANSAVESNHRSDLTERDKLLEALKLGKSRLDDAAETLYAHLPVSHEEAETYCQTVIATVDDILSAGDWQSSLFLRNLIKPVLKAQAEAQNYLGQGDEPSTQPEKRLEDGLGEDQQFLYVSLFQARGHDVRLWEKQVKCLNRYIVGRPIYANEDNVKKVIRLKENSANEAYVVLAVDKKFIQKPNAFEVDRKDRYGNNLETLKPGVITEANIFELVHDGIRYRYQGGRLIKA